MLVGIIFSLIIGAIMHFRNIVLQFISMVSHRECRCAVPARRTNKTYRSAPKSLSTLRGRAAVECNSIYELKHLMAD